MEAYVLRMNVVYRIQTVKAEPPCSVICPWIENDSVKRESEKDEKRTIVACTKIFFECLIEKCIATENKAKLM